MKILLALVALLAVMPVSPTAPITPDALVAALYKQHETKSPFFQVDDRALLDAYFAAPLADLLWKDAKESKGEVGAIDADPLYDSNDPEPKDLVIHPAKISGDKATVAVTFMNLGKKQRIVFELVPVGKSWRISDVIWSKKRTMLGVLKAASDG